MNVLAISAHADDAELGCSATLHKLVTQGHEVTIAAFCAVVTGVDYRQVLDEFESSAQTLDATPIVYDYPKRHFPETRQRILDTMIELRETQKPDVVFIPSRWDKHQDHGVIYEEALRAFPEQSLYSYETPWNQIGFEATAFSVVDEADVEMKLECLGRYESQKGRPYFSPEVIRALLMARGLQVKAKYAEAFNVVRAFV